VEKFRLFEPGQAWSRAEQINPFGRRRKPEIPMSAIPNGASVVPPSGTLPEDVVVQADR